MVVRSTCAFHHKTENDGYDKEQPCEHATTFFVAIHLLNLLLRDDFDAALRTVVFGVMLPNRNDHIDRSGCIHVETSEDTGTIRSSVDVLFAPATVGSRHISTY